MKKKFKYIIKKDNDILSPYCTIVWLKENPLVFEMKVSQTLWGAKRRIKKLKEKLIWRGKIIEEGDV